MTLSQLHVPAGSATRGGDPLVIEPESAGWNFTGLHIVALEPGQAREIQTVGVEMAVLPLSGSLSIDCDGERIELSGRETVFSGVTDWLYVPVGSRLSLVAPRHAEIALCTARATHRLEMSYQDAASVPVEYRGAGAASRQIVNFMTPSAFPGAQRLICVEVYTPDGNCSSYPPHRHDSSPDCTVALEEIYYFRIGRLGSRDYEPHGIGLHHTYTPEGDIDSPVVIRDGDAFLVRRAITVRPSRFRAIRCITSTCLPDRPTVAWTTRTILSITGLCVLGGTDTGPAPPSRSRRWWMIEVCPGRDPFSRDTLPPPAGPHPSAGSHQ